MKNHNVLRILALVFALVIMLVIASCNKKPEETTPVETTPEPTTPAHVHTEEVIPAVAASCTETGLTEGKKCSECDEILVAQNIVEKLAHTEEVISGKAATCNEAGLTEGKRCTVCNEILVEQTLIEKLSHTEVVIEAVPATCTEAGSTAGKKCSACETVLEAPTEIAALGHNFGDVNVTTAPTCAEGKGTHTCGRCNTTEEVSVAPIAEHTFKAAPSVINVATCTVDGSEIYYCTACGGEKKTTLTKLGHKAGTDGVCTNCKEYKKVELVWNDNKAAKVNTQNPPTSFYDINGWSVTNWIDKDSLPEGTVLILKGGYIQMERLIDKSKNNARGGQLPGPVTAVLDDEWWGEYTSWAILCGSGTKNSIELWSPVEGVTPSTHAHSWQITENVVASCKTSGEWTMTCECGATQTKAIAALGHSRYSGFTNFNCSICGEACEYPAINTFTYEIVTMAPALPEKFKNAIKLTVFDAETWGVNPNPNFVVYDEIGATDKADPMPAIHIYNKDANSEITWNVEVSETGVYEILFHMRIKDNLVRGTKLIVNKGTPNEQTVLISYDLSGTDYTRVMDYEVTKSTYLYGASLTVNLVEGTNVLNFAWPEGTIGDDGAFFYFRDIYLLKTDKEYVPAHAHTWGDEQTQAATCTEDGKRFVACTNADCKATKTLEVLKAGHTKGDLLRSNDPTCISQRENIYDCTACDDEIIELDASTGNTRLNHTLDENNKCTRCQTQFKELDLGFTLGKKWDNTSIYLLFNMAESSTESSTKVFKASELPVGSIIKVAAGYDAKIDGWDIFRTGVTGPRLTRRYTVSSYGARAYWNDGGKEFVTQLDPTLGARYGEFFFTIKREDGKPLTAEDLTKALVVLVPVK